LKKRNKKLLLFAPSRWFNWASQVLPLIGKGFLVLFFKKELLPSACLPFSVSRSQRGRERVHGSRFRRLGFCRGMYVRLRARFRRANSLR
jgi:hypothetical protein